MQGRWNYLRNVIVSVGRFELETVFQPHISYVVESITTEPDRPAQVGMKNIQKS
jgi:hypothetical protein